MAAFTFHIGSDHVQQGSGSEMVPPQLTMFDNTCSNPLIDLLSPCSSNRFSDAQILKSGIEHYEFVLYY